MLLLYVGARYLGFAGQNVIRTSRWNEIHGRWNGLKPTESFTERNLLRFDLYLSVRLSLPLKIWRLCPLWGNYLTKILKLAFWHRNSVVVPSKSLLGCVQCLLCIDREVTTPLAWVPAFVHLLIGCEASCWIWMMAFWSISKHEGYRFKVLININLKHYCFSTKLMLLEFDLLIWSQVTLVAECISETRYGAKYGGQHCTGFCNRIPHLSLRGDETGLRDIIGKLWSKHLRLLRRLRMCGYNGSLSSGRAGGSSF